MNSSKRAVHGQAGVINFDIASGGAAIASGTDLTNTYASVGVTFSVLPCSLGVSRSLGIGTTPVAVASAFSNSKSNVIRLAMVLLTATEVLVKDYRGKNAEQEIWKFDAALVSQDQRRADASCFMVKRLRIDFAGGRCWPPNPCVFPYGAAARTPWPRQRW